MRAAGPGPDLDAAGGDACGAGVEARRDDLLILLPQPLEGLGGVAHLLARARANGCSVRGSALCTRARAAAKGEAPVLHRAWRGGDCGRGRALSEVEKDECAAITVERRPAPVVERGTAF